MSYAKMRRRKPNLDKREVRIRSCESKTRYGGGGIAAQEAKRFGMNYYYCSYCHGFHLTSRR